MIRPTKYMDPKSSVLSVSAEILSELLKRNLMSLQELDDLIQNRIDQKANINFTAALNFLYLLGCLDYDTESDVIYYVKDRGINL